MIKVALVGTRACRRCPKMSMDDFRRVRDDIKREITQLLKHVGSQI